MRGRPESHALSFVAAEDSFQTWFLWPRLSPQLSFLGEERPGPPGPPAARSACFTHLPAFPCARHRHLPAKGKQ